MTHNRERDIRAATTSKIWGLATGMLALCIPLVAVSRSGPILPLAVITGAAVGTVAVWRNSDNQSGSRQLSANQVKELEHRLANLEAIVSNQELDLQRKINLLESKDS